MPKNDKAVQADTTTTTEGAADAAPAELARPRLGELIAVKVAEGHCLVNNETGTDFAPDTATYQTVTVTTLRRLDDGDLVRVPMPE